MTPLFRARALALVLPALLLAGAWGFQLIGHMPPCEMCHWQRWPHYAAVVVALGAIALGGNVPVSRALTLLAGLLILVSGGIGLFHAGVEYHWWTGPTRCTANIFAGGGDPLKAMLSAPLVRCDAPAWTLGGVSLAGFNAIISGIGGLVVLWLASRPVR